MREPDRRLVVAPDTSTAADLGPAINWLAAGGVVAYPTDTFYGLAVDPGSPAAVANLFALKGRSHALALPLVAASVAQVEAHVGDLPGRSAALAAAFWPGPLSLIVDAPDWIAPDVHGGRGTVAIRVPDHHVARMLADGFGRPVTATSANRSGAPAALTAAELADLADDPRVLIVDAGRAPGGPPSTSGDARYEPPGCVRPGAIAWERVLTSR